uniref:single-stranded DNA cytosine deaminase n=2 Tax=Pteropus vampyrus TaxID=132908 RepID=A0A2R2X2K0_PTEVA|nr:apolipoprotein B mRNA editing enzyme catalytic polypeptide-like 3Z2Bd-Z3 [Pteropus vampyrus]
MAGLGHACEGCCGQMPEISYPMEGLDPETFFFEFKNLPYAYGRKSSYLCFQVEREQHSSPVPSDCGVFKNQPYHAELRFLNWFRAEKLSPYEHYDVTWFLSWSPCSTCAKKIAIFLSNHKNVRLSIFVSRIYYFWKPAFRQGLQELDHLGVQLDAMSFHDFKYCWENFVDNQEMPFRCWKKVHQNYKSVLRKLNEILRNMNLLSEKTFNYHFGNQLRVKKPQGRRRTYLCYKLKLPNETLVKGYFINKKKNHAEIRFINKIRSLNLDQTQSYKITCYITWSPCSYCAGKLVALVKSCPHLSLQIFTSRLYYHWLWKNQAGLRYLWKINISVLVMKEPEFADCWDNFVNHQSRRFKPWEKLTQYSNSTERRLLRILRINRTDLFLAQSSEQDPGLNDLVDAIKRLFLDAHRPRD